MIIGCNYITVGYNYYNCRLRRVQACGLRQGPRPRKKPTHIYYYTICIMYMYKVCIYIYI